MQHWQCFDVSNMELSGVVVWIEGTRRIHPFGLIRDGFGDRINLESSPSYLRFHGVAYVRSYLRI